MLLSLIIFMISGLSIYYLIKPEEPITHTVTENTQQDQPIYENTATELTP
jgi:hypothetical protein